MPSDSERKKGMTDWEEERIKEFALVFQSLLDKSPENPLLDLYSLSDARKLAEKYAEDSYWAPPHGNPEHYFRTCSVETEELEGAITDGPVLSLGIKGVLVLGRDGVTSLWPNGFYHYPPGVLRGRITWHPRLLDWLRELNDAFVQVAWNSSLSYASGQIAACIGADFAEKWGELSSKPEVPGRERFSDAILRGYCGVAKDVPLAMVDDQFLGDPSVREFISARSAPTLVLIPNPNIGLGRAAVDLLLEFATDPWQEKFSAAEPLLIYASKKLRWADDQRNEDKVKDDPKGWTGSKKQLRPDEQNLMYELAGALGHYYGVTSLCEGNSIVADDSLFELAKKAGIEIREGKSVAAASPDQPECVKFGRMLEYHRFVERWFTRL